MYYFYDRINSELYLSPIKIDKISKIITDEIFQMIIEDYKNILDLLLTHNNSYKRFNIHFVSKDLLNDELLNFLDRNKIDINLFRPDFIFYLNEKIINYQDIKFIENYIFYIKKRGIKINLYHLCDKVDLQNLIIEEKISFSKEIYQKINNFLSKHFVL